MKYEWEFTAECIGKVHWNSMVHFWYPRCFQSGAPPFCNATRSLEASHMIFGPKYNGTKLLIGPGFGCSGFQQTSHWDATGAVIPVPPICLGIGPQTPPQHLRNNDLVFTHYQKVRQTIRAQQDLFSAKAERALNKAVYL